jgi:hypothetical protein
VLAKVVTAGGAAKSYQMAALLLDVVGEVSISSRQVNKLTEKIAGELEQQRDEQTRAYQQRPLPRRHTEVSPPPQLACVSVDGGRMQTRVAGRGSGVHGAAWRETKNAVFIRMQSRTFGEDPHPELPRVFADRGRVAQLLPEAENAETPEKTRGSRPPAASRVATAAKGDWRPRPLFRTCLSSLTTSEQFGPMMAAEADSRGFFHAAKRAFLGDGQAYNWKIQQTHFPTFTPIIDFVHAIEYVYRAARAVADDEDHAWEIYVPWATACWQGGVAEVITQLEDWQSRLGPLPEQQAIEETDPRQIVARTLTYLNNNRGRMDYPAYRRAGLPVTSSLMESLIKEINHRVKGTEKFWNDGLGGEAILQVRAALLSDDNRLANHLAARPGCPYHPRASPPLLTTAP